jgi:hypothetical protein
MVVALLVFGIEIEIGTRVRSFARLRLAQDDIEKKEGRDGRAPLFSIG